MDVSAEEGLKFFEIDKKVKDSISFSKIFAYNYLLRCIKYIL